MEKKYIWAITVIIGASLITVLGISIPIMMLTFQCRGMYWPTDYWCTVNPEDQGLNSSKFEDMYDYIQNNSINLHSVLIVRNNYIVDENFLENYVRREEKSFAPHWMVPTEADHMHQVYSCTKSIVSLLIGIAMEMGYIDNLNQTIYEFFEDYWSPSYDERKKNITIWHLLTQTSGFPYGGYSIYQSYIQESLSEPLLFDPGEGWLYSNTGCFLLSAIINITTGMKTSEFARDYLFEPIGISQKDWSWIEDYQGITNGAYGICFTPRVMAKIGILCLNNGSWNGNQIVPKEWTIESTSPNPGSNGDYGYLWWVNPLYYLAAGYSGQWITVIPDYDFIVIFTAEIPDYTYIAPYDYIIRTFIIGSII
ncbi:MAG: serine hydrolase domain-containing protein [Candidatus Hodarchaeota archaeon]